jgi:hypothetical protein
LQALTKPVGAGAHLGIVYVVIMGFQRVSLDEHRHILGYLTTIGIAIKEIE